MTTRRILGASSYPVDLAEVKLFLRVTQSAEDSLIEMMLASATEHCENLLQRSLIDQTWTRTLDAFEDSIALIYPPIQSIVSVAYLDVDGVAQVVDLANVQLNADGTVVAVTDFVWPATYGVPDAVTITYVTGYGYAAQFVPAPIRSWILMRCATLYEMRSLYVVGHIVESLPYVDGLLDMYRIHTMANIP